MGKKRKRDVSDLEERWRGRNREREPITAYFVEWDNGADACGTFPQEYDTYDAADTEGRSWADECNLRDFGTTEPEDGGYSYEVVEREMAGATILDARPGDKMCPDCRAALDDSEHQCPRCLTTPSPCMTCGSHYGYRMSEEGGPTCLECGDANLSYFEAVH